MPSTDQQSFKHALAEAFGHRSYVLLVLGFFTCGFQLAFITVHLPAYLVDRGMPVQTGGWVIAVDRPVQHRGLAQRRLAAEHVAEALHPVGDLFHPRDVDRGVHLVSDHAPSRRSLFGVVSGLTWLSTVPPTSALVALMFGTRWLATLYGFAFFSHQVGGFLGVCSAASCSRNSAPTRRSGGCRWLFGVLSALINLPIVEAPVARPVAQPA